MDSYHYYPHLRFSLALAKSTGYLSSGPQIHHLAEGTWPSLVSLSLCLGVCVRHPVDLRLRSGGSHISGHLLGAALLQEKMTLT